VTTGNGATADMIGRSSAAGSLRQTDRPFDVAIEGPGFIQVRRADGSIALTRDGSLQVAGDGRLRTSSGDLLEPPVTIPEGVGDQVGIAPDGAVTGGGRVVGRITVVTVPAIDGLQAVGDNLFVPTAASGGPRPAAGARLQQGVLESSNVDLSDAMVDMMDAQRSFALASKALTMQDEAWGIANGVRR
jgi:flagellar basal-body rod protein FlgG